MIALDTNVLLRFMLRDDETHYQIIAPQISAGTPEAFLISHLVCLETDWVLESCYNLTKSQRLQFMNTILAVKQFTFENKDTIKRALVTFENFNIDFSDALIAAHNKHLGATETITFDKSAKAAGMHLLK